MKKHMSIIFAIVFFVLMIICTILARPIHDSRLPNVNVEKVRQRPFTISLNLEDGTQVTTSQGKLAIPIDIVREGSVYLLQERKHYNEMESYVELVYIELGQIEGDYVEVKEGLSSNDKIIIESERKLRSGERVLVSN